MTKRAIRHITKEQFVRRVRYIGELTIYFRDKDAILISDGKNLLLCERWFEGRGFYARSWRPFAEALTRNNSLETLSDVLRLATKHGITTHAPMYEKFEITEDTVVLPAQYKGKKEVKMEKLIVYTKFCLPCVMPEFWDMFQKEALKQGYEIKVCRTTYRPFAHKKATEIWGAEGYTAFGVFPDGQAIALERILDMWTDNVKNKRVKAGKKKTARKGKNDVQGLPKTSRSIRVDSVESPATKIKVENA